MALSQQVGTFADLVSAPPALSAGAIGNSSTGIADGKKELFNIAEDIGEQKEISALHPDKVAELSERLGNYLRKAGALRPSYKSNDTPAPWPDENH